MLPSHPLRFPAKPGPALRVAAVAAVALLSACQPGDEAPVQGPAHPVESGAGPAAFDREVLSIKAAVADHEERSRRIREAALRHGFPVGGASEDAVVPAAKAAALDYHTVKSFAIADSGNLSTFSRTIPVRNGEALLVWTEKYPGPADPCLVLWISGDASKSHSPRILGVNDDRNTSALNAEVQWTNNTGADVVVTYTAFAFNDHTHGFTRMGA